MKKLLLGALLLLSTLSLVSCNDVNYEIDGYFTNSDWKSHDEIVNKKNDTYYSIDTKINIKNEFYSVKDDVKFRIIDLTEKKISLLPKQDKLKKIIISSLEKCKSNCKNDATFDPKEISISVNDKSLDINITFLASNSYGTPGELHGYFTYDIKTNKLLSELVF
jgi:hypothetical protein